MRLILMFLGWFIALCLQSNWFVYSEVQFHSVVVPQQNKRRNETELKELGNEGNSLQRDSRIDSRMDSGSKNGGITPMMTLPQVFSNSITFRKLPTKNNQSRLFYDKVNPFQLESVRSIFNFFSEDAVEKIFKLCSLTASYSSQTPTFLSTMFLRTLSTPGTLTTPFSYLSSSTPFFLTFSSNFTSVILPLPKPAVVSNHQRSFLPADHPIKANNTTTLTHKSSRLLFINETHPFLQKNPLFLPDRVIWSYCQQCFTGTTPKIFDFEKFYCLNASNLVSGRIVNSPEACDLPFKWHSIGEIRVNGSAVYKNKYEDVIDNPEVPINIRIEVTQPTFNLSIEPNSSFSQIRVSHQCRKGVPPPTTDIGHHDMVIQMEMWGVTSCFMTVNVQGTIPFNESMPHDGDRFSGDSSTYLLELVLKDNKSSGAITLLVASLLGIFVTAISCIAIVRFANQQKKDGIILLSDDMDSRLSIGLSHDWMIESKKVRLGREIGAGASAQVFEGTYCGELVAVKKMYRSEVVVDQFRDFFDCESSILTTLHHPNVVRFYGAITGKNRMCLVTEYCESSLADVVVNCNSKGSWSLNSFCDIALAIANGMAFLHSRNIIHRDLKPENVLIHHDVVKICDFGMSHVVDCKNKVVSMTAQLGTPAFLAPELASGSNAVASFKVDVYAYGMLLYYMWTRTPPYYSVEFNHFQLLDMVSKGYRPDVPLDMPKVLRDLMVRCWSQDPMKRPTFDQIIQFIGEIVGPDYHKNSAIETRLSISSVH